MIDMQNGRVGGAREPKECFENAKFAKMAQNGQKKKWP